MAKSSAPIDPAALAKARRALAAASGKRRLDLILDAEDPAALVRALPADDLYLTVREIGLGDAVPIVELATPQQFRTFIDLAGWKGHEVQPRRILPWLRAARAGALRSDRAEARWRQKLAALDAELVSLLLRDAVRVHDLEEEEDPHIEHEQFMRTPEGKHILEFLVDGTEYLAVRGLVDDLFAQDPFVAMRLIGSIRSDFPSELEESALRWRTGRMADLGYPSLDEALSWFARPGAKPSQPAGTPDRPPGFFIERLGTGSLLARAAALLQEGEREHLELELVTAANAVLVADAVDPGDHDEVRAAVTSGRALVELGLEETAGSDERRAAEILATTAVKSLFQRGFGRVLALRWRAERIFGAGGAGSRESPFLDAPLGEMLAALSRRRPLYVPGLELPRDRWATPEAAVYEPRPFLSSGELLRTAEALGQAEGLASLAASLGLAPPAPQAVGAPPSPRLAALYLTARANELLGRAFAPAPIPLVELPASARAVLDAPPDSRLTSAGEAGALLAVMARSRAEELAPLVDGSDVPAGAVTALVVE